MTTTPRRRLLLASLPCRPAGGGLANPPRPCRPAALALLLALLLALTSVAPVSARQAEAARRPFANGSHVFRRILLDQGLEPLKDFDQVTDPARTILIILGDLDVLQPRGQWSGLAPFLRAGGAALLASDRQPRSPEVRQALRQVAGADITGRTLVYPVNNPSQRYRDRPFCPFLQPVPSAVPDLFSGASTLVGFRLQVATNLPSALRQAGELPPDVSLLARLPTGCKPSGEAPATTMNPLVARGFDFMGAGKPFAVGGDHGRGRFVLLADHSVFINEMMLPDDNNNVEFTDNAVAWLRGRDRTQALFVEDGKVRASFDVPMKAVDIDVNRLLVKSGQWLVEQERTGAYNRGLLRRISPDPRRAQRWLYRGAILALSVALALGLYHRVGGRGRYRPEPGVPRLELVVQHHTPERALIVEREQALLAAGNLAPAARLLARHGLAALGCAPPDGPGEPGGSGEPGAPPPPVVVAGNWWTRRRWARCVQRLWQLATAPDPRRVSAAACRRLARDVEELSRAVARGTVRPAGNPS